MPRDYANLLSRFETILRDLPILALLAYAARCARRVQPVFQGLWSRASMKHLAGLRGAVVLSERLAAGRFDVSTGSALAEGLTSAGAHATAAARGAERTLGANSPQPGH